MNQIVSWRASLGIGTLIGVLVLGFAGRVVMAVLAWMWGMPTNLSMGSVFVAVFTGAAAGLLGGGMVRLMWHRFHGLNGPGIATGFLLFGISLLISWPGLSRGGISVMTGTTVAAAIVLFLTFGLITSHLMGRMGTRNY